MNNQDLNDIIEIRDPEIDAEAVMHQIRENIRKRRAEAEAKGLDYEAFVEGLYASKVSARFDHQLYYDLRRMGVGYDKVGVGLSLTESRIPVIAPVVQRIRHALHHLVIYYVNQLAAQQARFNEYVVRALTNLVKALEDDPVPDDVAALQEEVQELRDRLKDLEMQVGAERK